MSVRAVVVCVMMFNSEMLLLPLQPGLVLASSLVYTKILWLCIYSTSAMWSALTQLLLCSWTYRYSLRTGVWKRFRENKTFLSCITRWKKQTIFFLYWTPSVFSALVPHAHTFLSLYTAITFCRVLSFQDNVSCPFWEPNIPIKHFLVFTVSYFLVLTV